ncbi:mitochondrial 37S ribosomal protein mS43 KNAG_0C05160 [Huiozyma naganishii CBS 8797]|uniref:Manganese/iron superoxide dismutase C-terminal domain-containing protein n=1 Tax=Huiozyma naganishii (strain ATCC MYA-139 / BCRC 22969 / CBS 8797 / KCTC 17520 / NBRC 10181 / NCYC 3082 / Yp74L-3) TaxID=1071383 RepID=J7RX45_HUIN7|nr:hypothetical protein KNAG_0C05160 [Kazachstania naganishii CBS 8797]CCK69617.1 hypothetical protein KNAG_0C05160 [Kazachstania naganishii CBS 8797]
MLWRGKLCDVARCRMGKRFISTRSLGHLTHGRSLPGVLSARGLQNSWFDPVEHYTLLLNKYTANNEALQQKSLETIIAECGTSATKKYVANYASLLFNREFALSCLRGISKPLPEVKPGREALLATPDMSLKFSNEPISSGNKRLQLALEASFDSMVQFRTLLLNSNLAINGDGFTWLVARIYKPKVQSTGSAKLNEFKYDSLFVLNTYNAGTPFTLQRPNELQNLENQYTAKNAPAEPEESAVRKEGADSYLNDLAPLEEIKKMAFDDTVYVPLLAIDASPKSWLTDYGVFGKQEYLDRTWEAINWKVIETRLPEPYEQGYL